MPDWTPIIASVRRRAGATGPSVPALGKARDAAEAQAREAMEEGAL